MTYSRRAGLGLAEPYDNGGGGAGGASADSGEESWVTTGLKWLGTTLFGGNPRSGGEDPCCPPGYNPTGTWPRNSGMQGAPPDYRTRGSPMEDPSPQGTGRKKDDVCDCIPIEYRGRYWMVGGVQGNTVYTGLPPDRDGALWVEVDRRTREPIFIPGLGPVSAGGAPAPASGSGSSSGSASGSDSGSASGTLQPAEAGAGSLGPLLAIGVLGALVFARDPRGPRRR